jgi:hypothetical protein
MEDRVLAEAQAEITGTPAADPNTGDADKGAAHEAVPDETASDKGAPGQGDDTGMADPDKGGRP